MAGINRGCRGLDVSGAGKRQLPRLDTGNAPHTYIARTLVSTVLFSHASARQAQTTGTRSQTSWHARSYSASIPKHARMRHHILTHTSLGYALRGGSACGRRGVYQKVVCWCRCSPVSLPVPAHVRLQRRASAGVAALRCRSPCRRTCDSNEGLASVVLRVAAQGAAAEWSTYKSCTGFAALRCRSPCRRTCDSNEELASVERVCYP